MRKVVLNIISIHLIVFLSILFCFNVYGQKESYKITGFISGIPDSTVFYLRDISIDTDVDSCLFMNGEFHFEGQIKQSPAQMMLLAVTDGRLLYSYLFIGSEELSINGDISDFPRRLKVSGSIFHNEYNELNKLTRSDYDKRDSLVQAYFMLTLEEQKVGGKKIWDKIAEIDKDVEGIEVEYIKSHPKSFTAMIELGYLKEKLPKDTVQAIFQRFAPEVKDSRFAKVLEVYLSGKIVGDGDQYHDFEALNQEAKRIQFSDIRKNYTLLDFTAAYCMPCIKSVEELKELDRIYNDSLQIISFSGDVNKEVWLESLKRDSISWLSLWDGEGRYSETSIKYGVSSYPTFVLISPEGRIIEKWAGYSKGSIKERLAEHFLPVE